MNAFYPLFAYSSARSALFSLEYAVLSLPLQREKPDPATALAVRDSLRALLKRDAKNIADGLYPKEVMRPESPMRHLTRLPRIIADGAALHLRRQQGKTTVFDSEAREHLGDVPRYYRRNFHFQTGGYLTGNSARLYEHQVEILFGGGGDAMRRLIIEPLRKKFGKTDGQGLTFLELGAGTGRATRFVRLAFPRAKIVAVDLSDPYLKQAERNLERFHRIDFVQADAAALPFADAHFDAVYSVFLFHELPLDAREAVLAESRRVLKRGGFVGLVDSLQTGDEKAFDGLLENFPKNYHEPFYRNYLAHPMEKLLKEQGFRGVRADQGFFSKVCWGNMSG